MGDYNDGKAFAYQTAGESVMRFDNTIKHAEIVVRQGIPTTLGITALDQSLDHVYAVADSLNINGINIRLSKNTTNHNGHVNQNMWMMTPVVAADVPDYSSVAAGCIKQAQTVVAGAVFDLSCISWHLKPNVLKKLNRSSSNIATKAIRMSNNYSNVGDIRKTAIARPLNFYLSASIYTLEDKYFIKNGRALVDDNQTVPIGSSANILQPVTASVEDYKPPTWGSTGSGSGVKNMSVVIQKNSFANIYMTFDDTKIIDVQGMPQGMSYNNQYIFGAPLTSGSYYVKIKLDNLRTLEMTMNVPEVPRTL